MFEPGHLHREIRADELSGQTFVYDLYYDVREDPEEGSMLHVRMTGTVDGKSFAEEFELHRDTAFNFFGVVTKLAVKHGASAPSSAEPWARRSTGSTSSGTTSSPARLVFSRGPSAGGSSR